MENQRIKFTRHSQTDIFLGSNLFEDIASKLKLSGLHKECVVITNETIGQLYLSPLKSALNQKNIKVTSIIIGDGESYKTIETVNTIVKQLIDNSIDRGCPFLGLGGGVVCDITGFVASTYKRGNPLILIPTSLLAMVDASFGGKNAINTEYSKNLLGTFHQPLMTFIDLNVLDTLPLSQIYYGLIEALKHGLIYDYAYFNFIVKNIDKIKKIDHPILQRVIRRSIFIKKEFISDDELDKGKRAHLNFGHTFGHGLETAGEYRRYNHAEAVGLGMLMAIKASFNLGILKEDFSEQLINVLKEIELPVTIPITLPKDKMIESIKNDKKRANGHIRFILPECPGKTIIHKVKSEDLEKFINDAMV